MFIPSKEFSHNNIARQIKCKKKIVKLLLQEKDMRSMNMNIYYILNNEPRRERIKNEAPNGRTWAYDLVRIAHIHKERTK